MTAVTPTSGPFGDDELSELVRTVLARAEEQCLKLACAESCTGGLICSLLTDVEGSGGAFDRGFVTYSDAAKIGMLGIDPRDLSHAGAVSGKIAKAMALGALAQSEADLAVSVTGYAGPVKPGQEEGLIHLAVAVRSGPVLHRECHFGSRGREDNRALAARAALEMLHEAMS